MSGQTTVPELKREVARIARLLHAKGFVANHEGNVTARLPDGRILATPTAVSKGDVYDKDILLLDRFGRQIQGTRKPFSELKMHLCVYRMREDVMAVVHAHPPTATAFAAVGIPVEAFFLPEFVVSMGGKVPVVPFALPGSEALNHALEPYIEEFDTVLLQNHGVLAWAHDVSTAYLRIEHCEEAAMVLLAARQLGAPREIPPEMVSRLLEARTRAGLGPEGRSLRKPKGA